MSRPPVIPEIIFDEHAAKLITQMQEEYITKGRCEEDNFDRMSSLLTAIEKHDWATRPRTYTVLRMINRIDVMDKFVNQDLRDINFPYSQQRLPACLSEMSDRLKFIEAQDHVTTPAKDIETLENKTHQILRNVADECFIFESLLGRGGFGFVHRVRSRLSFNEFALKRSLRGKMFVKDKGLHRIFVNDLTISKKLSHEHLVVYVGSYTDPKWLGLLMSPVADCDLRHFLGRPVTPEKENTLRQFYGCLTVAIQYLHQNRIRHKDLKPQNILVKGSKVLITDFGTALDWSEESRATTTGDPGPISINYAAPEVVDREKRSESSDIWSLGCVFVDMTVVLKGYTDDDRRSFFTNKFTGSSNYWANPEALEAWLRKLEEAPQDNITLSWIRSMIHPIRSERIAISSLVEQIIGHHGDHGYYGPCCAGHDDLDSSSYGGSPTYDTFAASVTAEDSLYAYPRPNPPLQFEPTEAAISGADITHLSDDRSSHIQPRDSTSTSSFGSTAELYQTAPPFPPLPRPTDETAGLSSNQQPALSSQYSTPTNTYYRNSTSLIPGTTQSSNTQPTSSSQYWTPTNTYNPNSTIPIPQIPQPPSIQPTRTSPVPNPIYPQPQIQPQPYLQPQFSPSKHGGGYNPNPAPSHAIQSIDALLGTRRQPSHYPSPQAPQINISDRNDALWQQAYFAHQYDASNQAIINAARMDQRTPHHTDRPRFYGPAFPNWLTQVPPSDTQRVGNEGGMGTSEQDGGNPWDSTRRGDPTSRPLSWDDVLPHTGISSFRA
ncbi:kinase-like domain-containing protein [Dendryphion nanum]|uniref:non-specific serine/threonine protein kinase n=1 Tax=Dendryphion nanum TaxID=256645 RepID=A0A9P9DDK5_9PLEO|nr:kinase-like domain-containing protein [Dendryphion nanum]